MLSRALTAFALLLVACEGGQDDTALDDTGDTGGGGFPDDPSPLSITFSGEISETIVFDQPSCIHYPPQTGTSFRNFWRGDGHNAVLIVQVLGSFDGAGTYVAGLDNLGVALQSEAGSPYDFAYTLDTTKGDDGSLTIDGIGDQAWGEFTFTGLHSATGSLTASPLPIPVWCPDVDNGLD